uniref:Uncharacterized protein n=1 Tax=Kalanchoe fedtschenkoi TaxID=63787 RepID=A0A7N0V6C1_KALFE
MMIKNKRGSGINGFDVPSIPKAPRSARRASIKRKLEGHQVCAFDLLAAVAGKLLQENENSSASSNETEAKDQFVMDGDSVILERRNWDRVGDTDFFHKKDREISDEHLSALSTSDGSENVETDLRIGISVRTDAPPKMCNNTKTAHHCKGSSDDAAGFEINTTAQDEGQRTGYLLLNNSRPSQDDQFVSAPDLHHEGSVKLVGKDDLGKYISRCSKSSKAMASRSPPHFGNIRVRKFAGYKYWKVSSKLGDHDSCAGEGERHVNCSRKTYHERDKGLDISLVKKRKLCDQSSVITSDRGVSSESFSKSHEKCLHVNKNSNTHLHGANEECSSSKNHPASDHTRDSQVRLSIKSFEVPELLVEVPVTATVGSLKTTVLEAVSSVLRGGLHVEVIVKGKKIRDDTNTLMQSGICHSSNLDSLGFMLEPSSPQAPSSRCQNDPVVMPASDDNKSSKRSPDSALAISVISDEPSPAPSLSKQVKIDHDAAPTASDALPERSQESKALALFPVTSADPLAIVPMGQKSNRSELAQRRTRRPFSVGEVEALVQAVEELGTGRWRDVKMRSFENAEHRTYVDLKDKWKTLVHTAEISPQQRRGQPVPQELLNRVLAAHAYWSQHHHVKSNAKPHFLR